MPSVVGAPKRRPVVPFSVRPTGNADPAFVTKLYGPFPPLTVRFALYGVATFPLGNNGAVTHTKTGLIPKTKFPEALLVLFPVTVMDKVKFPGDWLSETMPERTPVVEFNVSPCGKVPLLLHVYGVFPSLAVNGHV